MPIPSLAREFYDRIVSAGDPIAAIRQLINSDPPTFESDVFDCKLEPIEPKQRDGKHKELWSEVLGGFGNAGGGVVIWGLDASKQRESDGRQIDAVCGERPIHNPLAVESRLRELQRQATDPPLAGVEIRSFPLPEDPARGFVICYVPEGPHKPYRSEHAGKHYYLRAGDNTPIMSRAVLASMFFPRSTPTFRVRAVAERKYVRFDGITVLDTILVYLMNTGTATAKDVHVQAMAMGGNLGGKMLKPHERWSSTTEGPLHDLRARDYSVHRGQIVHLCDVSIFQPVEPGDEPDMHWAEFTLYLTVYCENQEPQVFSVEFDDSEFGEERCLREFDSQGRVDTSGPAA